MEAAQRADKEVRKQPTKASHNKRRKSLLRSMVPLTMSVEKHLPFS
jgi:hypothetical protein